ncbi:MAG: tetratricopeptide repeat protein [Leptonema sp. (in: bacteria)]
MKLNSISIICILFFSFSLLGQSKNLFYAKKALAEKNYSKALELLNKEIKANPHQCEAYFYSGIALEKMNQKEKSISNFLTVTKMNCDPKLKEQAFWKVLSYYKYIEDWENLYLISKSFLQFKPDVEVEKIYKISQEKQDPKKTKILELLVLAEKLEKNNEWLEAAKAYKELFSLTNEVEYLLKSASIYKNNKKDKEAFENFLEVLSYQPNHWYANYQVGIYYYYYGQPEECIRYLINAEKNNPKPEINFLYYLNLAKAYCYLNSEVLDKFKETFLDLKKMKIKKEENYFLIESFYLFFINQDLKLNQTTFDFSKKEEGFTIFNLVRLLYKDNIEEIYKIFISNPFDDFKYIRWSNFINQLLVVMLIEYRNDIEKSSRILSLLEKNTFKIIKTKPHKNLLINTYLKNHVYEKNPDIDSKFIEAVFSIETQNVLPFTLSYHYYLNSDFEKLKENLNVLKENNVALLYYFKFIYLVFNQNFSEGIENLKKSKEMDPDFSRILENDKKVQGILKENKQLKKEIEEALEFSFF